MTNHSGFKLTRMAMRYADAIEPLKVRWFEEPTQWRTWRAVLRWPPQPHSVGRFETEAGKYQFARLIDAGAI